jgi:DoxX-like family
VTYALWTVQVLLAIVFALAGGIKLILPVEVLNASMQLQLPGVFIRFIGVAEVLAALGMILPGVFHVHPELTPLAALGLVAVMLGALMFMPPDPELVAMLLPIILGVLAGCVAFGRSRSASRRGRTSAAGRLRAAPGTRF